MNTEKQLFDILIKSFEEDTGYHSSVQDHHPYFRTIVGWGKMRPNDVIPWLLNELERHWLWCVALMQIVGEKESPTISEENAGRSEPIVKAWLDWGRARGYLIVESK